MDAAKENIKRKLQGISRVSLAIDAWASHVLKSAFLAIKAYWIDAEWVFHEELLDFPVIEQRHTGAYFARMLQVVLDEFELGHRLLSITADNAGNNGTMHEAM